MKRLIKHIVYGWLYPFLLLCSFDKLLRTFSRHERLIIFFHGVGSVNPFQINGRHLPLSDFEKLLNYFKRNFDVVSLQEICSKNFKPRRKTIALTLDDGFQNNIDNALPALERYEVPATFFVSTRSLEDPGYIHPSDFMDLVKIHAKGRDIGFNGEIFKELRGQLCNTRNGQSVYHYLCGLSLDESTAALKRLSDDAGPTLLNDIHEEVYKLVTRDTFQALLSSQYATVGSHSHEHVNLCRLTNVEIKQQLTKSKEVLEKCGCSSVQAIAFPYGGFNDDVLKEAYDAGFGCMLAGGDVSQEDRHIVFPRIGVSSKPGVASTILSINRGFGRFGF